MADVLFDEVSGKHAIGVITLNRQSRLNALTPAMVNAIYSQLQKWEASLRIQAIIIQPAQPGRAFSAGGDLRVLFEHYDDPSALDFFHIEYRLNYLIHCYKKPIIAWMNGITMGGGAGLAIHASHRVCTPALQFAMPETAIGFFPDIGATYFLPRLAAHWGWYLGLTGNQIDAATCLALGLATHQSVDIQGITQALIESDAKALTPTVVSEILATKHTPLPIPANWTADSQAWQQMFDHPTLLQCWHYLQASKDETAQKIYRILQKKSPLSLQITFRALQLGLKENLQDAFARETKMALHFMQTRELYEGIRAQLIEKDYQPQWQHTDVLAVSDTTIAGFFA